MQIRCSPLHVHSMKKYHLTFRFHDNTKLHAADSKTALLSYSLSNLLTEADSSKAPTFEESSCNPTASGPTGRIYTLSM